MEKRRVVITGLGVISPLGVDLPTTWAALLAGKSGVAPLERFDVSGHSAKIAAIIKGYDPLDYFSKPESRHLDFFSQYALIACREAIADSGIDFAGADVDRCGVIFATGVGGIQEIESQDRRFIEKGPKRISPHFVPKMMPNAVSGQIGIKYGLKGPNFVAASACASSGHAIGLAMRMIQWGEAEVMVTGGSEAAITPLSLAGFGNMKALSLRNDDPEKASRPYDQDRNGFVMGEGGATLILEDMERAKARGAKIYAELKGFGMNDDAFHITAPDETGSGARKVMELALKDAGLDPTDIDYVNGHGTSTPLNDKIECLALKLAFGDHTPKMAVSSTKSMIGHLLGGSAAVELSATALGIYEGKVHLSANLENPEAGADLDFVMGSSREMKVRNAIKNSFGFGGHNSSLILGTMD